MLFRFEIELRDLPPPSYLDIVLVRIPVGDIGTEEIGKAVQKLLSPPDQLPRLFLEVCDSLAHLGRLLPEGGIPGRFFRKLLATPPELLHRGVRLPPFAVQLKQQVDVHVAFASPAVLLYQLGVLSDQLDIDHKLPRRLRSVSKGSTIGRSGRNRKAALRGFTPRYGSLPPPPGAARRSAQRAFSPRADRLR